MVCLQEVRDETAITIPNVLRTMSMVGQWAKAFNCIEIPEWTNVRPNSSINLQVNHSLQLSRLSFSLSSHFTVLSVHPHSILYTSWTRISAQSATIDIYIGVHGVVDCGCWWCCVYCEGPQFFRAHGVGVCPHNESRHFGCYQDANLLKHLVSVQARKALARLLNITISLKLDWYPRT